MVNNDNLELSKYFRYVVLNQNSNKILLIFNINIYENTYIFG